MTKYTKASEPSGWKEYAVKVDSSPLTDYEDSIFNEIAAGGLAYHTKRQRTVIKSNGIEPHKWEVLGFSDYIHYQGWIHFNSLYRGVDADSELNKLFEGD